MGDSDRMRNYISDYLENSLDPTMHKEFEDALKRSPDLRSMTDKLTSLTTRLGKLEYHKCSDDFSVKLREKIHTSSEPLVSHRTMVRYSFAASFVIILVIAIFAIANLSSESSDINSPLQGSAGNPASTTDPVKNPVSGSNESTPGNSDNELDIGTKDGPNVAIDSTKGQEAKKKNEPAIKRVDLRE